MKRGRGLVKKALFACAIGGACVAHNAIAQDVRGYSVRLEAVNPWTGLWLAEIKLYVDADLEIDRPYILEFSYADTLWLASRVPLGLAGDMVMKSYSGWLVLPMLPGTTDANFSFGPRTPEITNVPDGSWIGCGALISAPIASPFVSHPIVFSHQNTVQNNQGVYSWDPNAWDPDGDSLHFELVPCFDAGYWPPPNTQIDAHTGVISSAPEMPGKYAYCASIEKFRRLNPNAPVLLVGYSRYEITFDVSTVVGMAEHSGNRAILVAPNPANDQITVTAMEGVMQRVRLFSADGRLLFDAAPGTRQINLECSSFAKGPCFVRIESGGATRTVKVMLE